MRNHFLRAAGKALWTPARITTALWLDAADAASITASGGAVSQWNDNSGNSRNFTSASGTRPSTGIATLNSKNVLSFNAAYVTSVSSAATWQFLHDATGSSIFSVASVGTTANPESVYGLFGNNATSTSSNVGVSSFYDDRSIFSANNRLRHQIGIGGNSSPVSAQLLDNFVSPNTANVLAILGDPSNATLANRSIITINGGTEQKTNTDSSSPSTSAPTFSLQLGACGNNALPLTGSMSEFIIISGLVSSTDRQRIEGYLAHKWGLSANLPADHPYKSAAPT